MFSTWREFYQSDLQGVYLLWVVPAIFLIYWLLSRPRGDRAVEPRAVAFLNVYAPLFVIETILDPFISGPVVRHFGIAEPFATYCMLPFVLLGDFRVYLLVFYLMAVERGVANAVVRAALWTLIVPLFAWSATRFLTARYGEMPSQTIWIAYESGFLAITLFLLFSWLPSRVDRRRFELLEYLQALLRYVALYYTLWLLADLLIVFGGYDFAWGLRAIPNQLYYSFWIPAAYMWFFSPRYAAMRRQVHAAR